MQPGEFLRQDSMYAPIWVRCIVAVVEQLVLPLPLILKLKGGQKMETHSPNLEACSLS